jgi:hypothetical protein
MQLAGLLPRTAKIGLPTALVLPRPAEVTLLIALALFTFAETTLQLGFLPSQIAKPISPIVHGTFLSSGGKYLSGDDEFQTTDILGLFDKNRWGRIAEPSLPVNAHVARKH